MKELTIIKTKSGWIVFWIALAMLILAIPLMIYGLGRASYNGVVWVSHHKDRKLAKMERKDSTYEVKERIAYHKQKRKNKKTNKEIIKEVENE